MKDDRTILPFRQSEYIDDPLTDIAREGARRMLAEALVTEADAFVASFNKELLTDGRQRIVRHGFGPDAPNLSPSVITRLTAGWQAQYDSWQRRDLSARRYVYIWAVSR